MKLIKILPKTKDFMFYNCSSSNGHKKLKVVLYDTRDFTEKLTSALNGWHDCWYFDPYV